MFSIFSFFKKVRVILKKFDINRNLVMIFIFGIEAVHIEQKEE